jgi:hypothetical protein
MWQHLPVRCRHCEKRSDEAIQSFLSSPLAERQPFMAHLAPSRTLSGEHSAGAEYLAE